MWPHAEAIFVGDSWEPDVLGPIAAGMRSVHVDRAQGEKAGSPPPLVAGAIRIGDLRPLLHTGILEGGTNLIRLLGVLVLRGRAIGPSTSAAAPGTPPSAPRSAARALGFALAALVALTALRRVS